MSTAAAPPPSPLASPEPWDLVSEGYTTDGLPFMEKFSHDALALAGVAAGDDVVDVACGPGTLSLLAAAAGARVRALDFSPRMVEQLRRRAAQAGATIDVATGDGQALPWPDGSARAAFSMFGLMFFPDRGAGFRELRRVLAPGGTAVVSSWEPFSGSMKALLDALRAAIPGLPFGEGEAPLGTRSGFEAELRAAGFEAVEIHGVTHSMESPSVDDFLSSMSRSLVPLVMLRRRLGEDAWAGARAKILAGLVEALGDGALTSEGHALLGVARR